MHLRDVDDLVARLDAEFAPLEPEVDGLRLSSPGLGLRDVRRAEQELGVTFPDDVRGLITAYDFGHFTLGPTAFGYQTNYGEYLVKANRGGPAAWWGPGERPSSAVVIANSDPYVVILECDGGEVFALEHGSRWADRTRVATTFRRFLLAVGDVFLGRLEERLSSPSLAIAARTRAQGCEASANYWLHMAR